MIQSQVHGLIDTAVAAVDGASEFKKTQYATPTTGQTVNHTSGKTMLTINPSGALLALTVNLSAGAYDGQILTIVITQTITTLTTTGSSLLLPLAASAVVNRQLRWSADISKWC